MSLVHLNHSSGAEAVIRTDRGFNCFRFAAILPREKVDVLWAHPNFALGNERPSGSGLPILFPFAGRIADARYTYQGREYFLENQDGMGNAIHGFVYDRAWRVIEQTDNSVTGEFHASQDDPTVLKRWPADFIIRATHRITGTSLDLNVQIINPDSKPLPMGLGLHPYYRLPLGAEGERDQCLLTAPAAGQWELIKLTPTGRRLENSVGPRLETGLRFGEANLDAVLDVSEKARNTEWAATIVDPINHRRLTATTRGHFDHLVAYSPPHREAVCLEPYSCVPNPFALGAAGIRSGLKLLPPGETFSAGLVITISQE